MSDEFENENVIMHYGTKRHSGRYPWGSGENPYQHSGDFLSRVNNLKKSGMSEKEIAKYLSTTDNPMTTTDLRTYVSIAVHERRLDQIAQIKSLKADGLNNSEIGRKMGINESTVRSLLNSEAEGRTLKAMETARMLKNELEKKGFIDIGTGAEKWLGISEQKLKEARVILEGEGYEVYGIGVPQVTNKGQQTNMMVLCKPGTTYSEAYKNRDNIKQIDAISYDGGDSYRPSFVYPASLDSKRLKIVYPSEGGSDKDGLIEIRRGVKDLSLGDSSYAQVRILVDGTHYLKGMAVYSDDLPKGVDIQFNTSKPDGTPALGPKDSTVLKPIKKDAENPFGSLIKEHGGQSYYDDPNGSFTDPLTGKKQSLSLINKRSDEGDWSDWSDKLPSQFLSKQNRKLIDQQLNLSIANKKAELEEINSLTNPVVKKHLLESFADGCDKTAIHLDAASLPRQKYQVIIPVNNIKDTEVYAPNYRDGEQVALIRYPHGGTFEIPILTVNNKNREGIATLGKMPKDAVGINSAVAKRLSGADFDGDTVMVIPINDKIKITSTRPFKPFDPSMEYPKTPGMRIMKEQEKQIQMGVVSNLITDMTIKGATRQELEQAVRHSMVVIDAVKHELDYKKSEKENHIQELKDRYQGYYDENGNWRHGAGTIISRAKSPIQVDERKEGILRKDPDTGRVKRYYIDPDTGEKLYSKTERTYAQAKDPEQNKWVSAYEENGKVFYKNKDKKYVEAPDGMKVRVNKSTTTSTRMGEAHDAFSLVSDAENPVEIAYARYANEMKALANKARLDMLNTPRLVYNSNANKIYAKEVKELIDQVNEAEKNSPRERQAQVLANTAISAKQRAYPDMTKEELKKISQQELTKARFKVGAKRLKIIPTSKQWEAIQAGAISNNVLEKILRYSDQDTLKKLATPKGSSTKLAPGKIARLRSMAKSGFTPSEIADAIGISISTVYSYVQG